MKRSAIALYILAALCLGGIAAVHVRLLGAADDVSFRETVLYGDIAAAEGLTLTARQSCNRQLYWDSVMPVSAPGLAQTEFTALSRQKPPGEWYFPRGMTMSLALETSSFNFGSGAEPSSVIVMMQNAYWEVGTGTDALGAMIRDALERTEVGTKHTETFRIRDYVEYLPISLHLDLGNGVMEWWNGRQYVPGDDTSGLSGLFDSIFRIPVPEDATYTVKLEKDEQGMVTLLETETNIEGGLDAVSLVTEGKCWFVPYSLVEEPLDLSELRDGYGLYCLPFSYRAQPDELGNKAVDLDTDVLHMVFPLAAEETPVELYEGADGTLLLVLRTEQGIDAAVLDIETEQLRERVTLFDNAQLGEGGWVFALQEDGSLYALCDRSVRYYERGADGCYKLLLDAPCSLTDALPEEYRRNWLYDKPEALTWDGERLAVVIGGSISGMNGWYYSNTRSELLLAGFNASGFRYCATLQSGGISAETNDYEKRAVWGEHNMGVGESTGLALAFDTRWSAEKTAAHEGISFEPDGNATSGSAIIGGADGATAIFVTQELSWTAGLPVLGVIVLLSVPLILWLRKRKKA